MICKVISEHKVQFGFISHSRPYYISMMFCCSI